jgi:DNA replication protein DnaC
MSIKEYAGELLLSYTASNHAMHIEEARNTGMPHGEFLEGVLRGEVEYRRANRLKKRMAEAKFPYRKYLADFDRSRLARDVAAMVSRLATLEFVRNKENVILIGNPGVGKTHLAIALGIEACMRDMRVLFTSVPNLVTKLRETMSLNQLSVFGRKFEKYDIVILDELGYVSFDKDGCALLFNLLSNRVEAGSTIVTTNLAFERWVEVFSKDAVLTGVIVDRIAHLAHVADMSGESYRIRETQMWMEKHGGAVPSGAVPNSDAKHAKKGEGGNPA